MKRLWITYCLWSTCGFFGAHHFYLGRDRQAFLWFVTFGGVIFGWMTDFCQIPDMVQQANADPECEKRLQMKRYLQSRPPFSIKRVVVQLLLACWWASTAQSAVPGVSWLGSRPLHSLLTFVACVLGVAAAVHTAGNIGSCRGHWVAPLLAAGIACVVFGADSDQIVALAAVIAFEIFAKRWRPHVHTVPSHSTCRRVCVLLSALCLFYGMYVSHYYFNAEVQQADGTRVPFRDAVKNFFHSQLWKELKDELRQALRMWAARGWRAALARLLDSWDPSGERAALRVLGLTTNATHQLISARYRNLSRHFHPDRFPDPAEKLVVERRFTEINVAYDTLVRARRSRKRSQNPEKHEEL